MSGETFSPVQGSASSTGKTVMVVDDDNGVLAMTHAILASSGFECITATSGEAAMEIYQQSMNSGQQIHLILLDLTLPGGMDGMETVKALRGVDPSAKVIAVSGYFDESAATVAQNHGFIGILPKPYTAERLAKVASWGVGRAAA